MTTRFSNEDLDKLARRRAGAKLGWYGHAAVYLVVNLFLFALSEYALEQRRWSVYPLLGWGLGLTLHGVAVFVLKYVRVLTADREYLIRTPLRELLPQLDPRLFWQVHRAHVVRAGAIDIVTRDESGKLWIALRANPHRIAVNRLYAHRFKAM